MTSRAVAIGRMGAVAAAGPPAAFNPLSIAWDHAYYLSGPEMAALGLADAAAIGTIPDEMATGDLTQATAAAKPTYRAASAGMNNKPIAEFDGTSDFIKSAVLTTINDPCTIVVVGRTRALSASNQYFCSHKTDATTSLDMGTDTTNKWRIAGNNNTVSSAAAASTTAHLFRRVKSNFADQLFVDETNVINSVANVGTETFAGITLGARGDGAAGTFGAVDIGFVGVKTGALTAGEITNLRAWAQTFYGTA